MRLYDDKICISGAQGADVTGLGAQEFRCRGFALPKSVESGNLSLNKVGIRWMSAKNWPSYGVSDSIALKESETSRCAASLDFLMLMSV